MHDLMPGAIGPTLPACPTCNGESVVWSDPTQEPDGPCGDCETGVDPNSIGAIRVALATAVRGPWTEEIEHCDCGYGYGCPHEPALYSVHLPDAPAWLPPSGRQADDPDSFWVSRCRHSELATMPLDTGLFLARSRSYVEALLAEIDRLNGDRAALLAALTSTETVDDPTLATTHPTGRRALRADEAQRVAALVADTLGGGS